MHFIYNFIKKEIHWRILSQAVLLLLPVFIGFMLDNDTIYFNVGLVTISLFIGAQRLKLGIYAITLHFLLIFICFSLLFFAFKVPFLFVVLCAGMAFTTIAVARYGENLRTLGNYTFIPAVYLCCELNQNATLGFVSTYLKFISLLPISWLSIWLLYSIPASAYKKNVKDLKRNFLRKIIHGSEFGKPEMAWIPPAIAIFLGVACAASLVVIFNLSQGEWVIWSVASVITIEFSSAKKKLAERLYAASIGIPLSLLIAQIVPKTPVVYSLAAIGVMLTLVIFKRYMLTFGARCFCITMAAYVASATPIIALARIINITLGGLIGVIIFYLTHLLFKHFAKNK